MPQVTERFSPIVHLKRSFLLSSFDGALHEATSATTYRKNHVELLAFFPANKYSIINFPCHQNFGNL